MKNRYYGLDIARCIAMCGIVCLHIIGNGGVLASSSPGTINYWMAWFLEVCAYSSVDLFALMSGYLGFGHKRFNSYRVFELLITVIIYCILITIGALIIFPKLFGSIKSIIYSLAPVLKGRYWYISCYIPLSILAPFINKGLEVLTIKQHRLLCIIILLIFSAVPSIFNVDFFAITGGYSFVWLALCYIMGAYIKREKRKLCNKTTCIIIYIVCALFLLSGSILEYSIFNNTTPYMISYISPFVLMMAISILCLCEQITLQRCNERIKNSLVLLSGVAFDVYIIHCHLLIFDYLIKDNFTWFLNYNAVCMPFLCIISVMGIYLFSAAFGLIRQKLFKLFQLEQFFYKITKGIFSYDISEYPSQNSSK